MTKGALNVNSPSDLLNKFKVELDSLANNPTDAYAALNAIRDGYHLREWIWHDILENDPAKKHAVAVTINSENDWNSWINSGFPNFKLVRELCNGSKHFTPDTGDKVTHSYQGGYDIEPLDTTPYDSPGGFNVEISNTSHLNVNQVIKNLGAFWDNLFKSQGWS